MQAVAPASHAGITIQGAIRKSGTQVLVEIDESGKSILDTRVVGTSYLQTDDHQTPGVLVTSAGKLITAYCGHNDGTVIRYRVGISSRIASLGDEQTVTVSPGAPTYPLLYEHAGTGDIYMLFRSGNTAWAMAKKPAGDNTFAFLRRIMSASEQSYCFSGGITGDVMRCFCQLNGISGTSGEVRVADINVVSGDIVSDGTTIGNLYSGSAASYSNWAEVFAAPDENHSNAFTELAADGRSFAGAVRNKDDNTGDYIYGSLAEGGDPFDPDDWTVTTIVATGGSTAGRAYFGGIALAQGTALPRVYLSRLVGGEWTLERWDADNAAGTSWSRAETIATKTAENDDVIFRPQAGGGGIDVIWTDVVGYRDLDDWDASTIKWASMSQ